MNLMLTQGNALRIPLDALEAWGKAKKDGASVTDLPMFSTPMEDRDDSNL